MKGTNTILAIILLITAGCGDNKQSEDAFLTVDVTNTPSNKKELILQDFMDVEYIPLETNDEFINQGFVQAIGKEFILVRNRNSDGDIFVYNRTGKALRKINRKGQGAEEYTNILGITLDESNKEMYVNDHYIRKIQVYDLDGNFKRTLRHKEGNGSLFYTDIFNYDNDHLICYDKYNKEIPFVLISKQDGSITQDIKIPYKEKKQATITKQTGENSTLSISPGPYRTIIPFKGNWMLLELSSDTIYSLLPDYSLRPFMVRSPSIQSMNPEVFMFLRLPCDRYYFMETAKNVWDFDNNTGFPREYFMYDRQEKAFFTYTVYNGDYSIKKEVYMNQLRPVDHDVDSWELLEAYQLVTAYEKGWLQGKLKEIAATLNEESNSVIMLVKHKK
ncbi:6-bladed beta-propeller [Parabacteroides pacaensis]|uniref:6-bladed beta-propeller n=1 Tax=Parabacteroides pacaensis TaxID=2086575 RepID=UPI000D103761|nr:6-bladed beta-propeller [Parabacteroides pacaensis]